MCECRFALRFNFKLPIKKALLYRLQSIYLRFPCGSITLYMRYLDGNTPALPGQLWFLT